ncbi:MAG: hypothetical protein QOD83_2776 [Solirubrobacteraceae bacterium]|nr:hypothetical protein [Solirubrobacteraceae bacterium]
MVRLLPVSFNTTIVQCPGPCHGADLSGSGASEGLAAGAQGGTCRMHVVDEHDPFRRRFARSDIEATGHAANLPRRPELPCRRPSARQHGHERQAGSSCECTRHQLRRIEAARPAPAGMCRDRHDRSLEDSGRRARGDVRGHHIRERARRGELQGVQRLARDPLIRHRRPCRAERSVACRAAPARARQRATPAAVRGQPRQRAAARAAQQAGRARGGRVAGRAARRNGEGDKLCEHRAPILTNDP